MMGFSDDQMARLYEKFILEYYRSHHSYLDEIKAGQVKWNLLDEEEDERIIRFLPVMQTDIMLRSGDRVLIIDAKFYSRTMQRQYDKYSLHSNNLYQIFSYVKNHDTQNSGNVSGLLLYAKTEEDITPDFVYNIGGNTIGAKTLDLNTDFSSISSQLDNLLNIYFPTLNERGRVHSS